MTTILEDAFNFKNICNAYLAKYDDEKNHDYDCKRICTGCGKTFCQIKTEENLEHDEELKDICWWGDDVYCSDHCYPR